MTFSADNRLGNVERACLLRAARVQLLVLKDQHDKLEQMAATSNDSRAAADSAAMELGCLQKAITWLWRDQLVGDS